MKYTLHPFLPTQNYYTFLSIYYFLTKNIFFAASRKGLFLFFSPMHRKVAPPSDYFCKLPFMFFFYWLNPGTFYRFANKLSLKVCAVVHCPISDSNLPAKGDVSYQSHKKYIRGG
jgi:hypothetical protein